MNVFSAHLGILLSSINKEQSTNTHRGTDEPQQCRAHRNKPDTKVYIAYDSFYMKFLEKNKTMETDIGLVVAPGWDGNK